MEEWVGKQWDRFIRRAAHRQHDAAAVSLTEVQRTLALMFRAAGGAHAVRLSPASERRVGGARDWVQRVAGTGTHAATGRLEPEALSLPPGAGFVWAAGEHSDMAAVRRTVLAKPGVDPKRMRISAYWKRGAADHHEDLASAA